MGARHSWWQKIQKQWRTILVAAIGVVFIAWIIAVVLPNGTGFNGYNQVTTAHTISGPSAGTITRTEVYQSGKTLWDLLQLLIIPLALAVIAYLFNRSERKNEQSIALDNQQEAMLQGYLDKMSELLLREKIREPVFKRAFPFEAQNEAQHVARARTLTILSKLDASRKRSVIQFLDESDLITKNECFVHLNATNPDGLNGADLSGLSLSYRDLHRVNLSNANLCKATLSETDLSGAVLSGANLREARLSWGMIVRDPTGAILEDADLREADLSGAIMNDVILINADLTGAILNNADLTRANLTKAKVTEDQLKQAKTLKGATMPDGSIHP